MDPVENQGFSLIAWSVVNCSRIAYAILVKAHGFDRILNLVLSVGRSYIIYSKHERALATTYLCVCVCACVCARTHLVIKLFLNKKTKSKIWNKNSYITHIFYLFIYRVFRQEFAKITFLLILLTVYMRTYILWFWHAKIISRVTVLVQFFEFAVLVYSWLRRLFYFTMDQGGEDGFSLMSPWLVVACAVAYVKLVNTALPNQKRVPSITREQRITAAKAKRGTRANTRRMRDA